jgi:hypothetical protein
MAWILMVFYVISQLMTFGVGNNGPAWVMQQHLQLGVTAAIVDDVPKVLPSSFIFVSLPEVS